MLTPFVFLVSPRKVYESLKAKPYWVAPFIITVLGLIVQTLFNNSWGVQGTIVQIRSLFFMLVFVTLLVLFLWSVVSVFFYLFIFIIDTNNSVTFRGLFSVVTYCGVITLIAEIANSLLIRVKLIGDILYSSPNQFPYGLDIFTLTGNPHPAFAFLLHSINPFTIWYFIFLSLGLSIVAGLSKKEAGMLSFSVFICGVAFKISYMLITGETAYHIMIN